MSVIILLLLLVTSANAVVYVTPESVHVSQLVATGLYGLCMQIPDLPRCLPEMLSYGAGQQGLIPVSGWLPESNGTVFVETRSDFFRCCYLQDIVSKQQEQQLTTEESRDNKLIDLVVSRTTNRAPSVLSSSIYVSHDVDGILDSILVHPGSPIRGFIDIGCGDFNLLCERDGKLFKTGVSVEPITYIADIARAKCAAASTADRNTTTVINALLGPSYAGESANMYRVNASTISKEPFFWNSAKSHSNTSSWVSGISTAVPIIQTLR